MPKFFDIHSHLNFWREYPDLDEVIQRMKEAETRTIVVGTDYESSKLAVELAEKHEEIYACIGVHPVDDATSQFEEKKFESLVSHPKVVAIGECGLDFYHGDKAQDGSRQEKLFLDQAVFAMKHKKPIMIHCRDAYHELLEILEPMKREYGDKLRGNVHFFAGDTEFARRFINIDFTLSFTAVITFARNYDEVIKFAPLETIMSETDAPYVSPSLYRGKRNEPAYVKEVVKKIAEIRNEDLETVQKTLLHNVSRVFKISS